MTESQRIFFFIFGAFVNLLAVASTILHFVASNPENIFAAIGLCCALIGIISMKLAESK